jgi:hypothetical protein
MEFSHVTEKGKKKAGDIGEQPPHQQFPGLLLKEPSIKQ